MKPDELWEKHLHNDMYITKSGFLAAIAERDAYVKAEAVKVCEKVPKCGSWAMEGLDNHSKITGWHEHQTVKDCAAAISKMELP